MRRFIIRLFSFSIGLLILISPLLFCRIGGDSWKYIDNPTALIIEKTERLENLASPKIVVVGGSSSFFGMNSELLEEELEKEVVNMSQFAGFGLNFMLQQTTNHIGHGDIVLLCSEYYLKTDIDDEAIEEIVKYYPAASKHFPEVEITKIKELRYNFMNNVESIFNFVLVPISRKSPIYKQSRVANRYGDNIGYIEYDSPQNRTEMPQLEYSYYAGIEMIKEYIDVVTSNGGKVYLLFPPISMTAYERNKTVLERYYMDYLQAFGKNVLCSPKEMVFEGSHFFDTYYHLNGESRDLRTERMIQFYNRKANE